MTDFSLLSCNHSIVMLFVYLLRPGIPASFSSLFYIVSKPLFFVISPGMKANANWLYGFCLKRLKAIIKRPSNITSLCNTYCIPEPLLQPYINIINSTRSQRKQAGCCIPSAKTGSKLYSGTQHNVLKNQTLSGFKTYQLRITLNGHYGGAGTTVDGLSWWPAYPSIVLIKINRINKSECNRLHYATKIEIHEFVVLDLF